ncbi:MAG TPA: MBL fold metallo-hydrolase [Blastocatellia bacterium]|nr:MBL fold metallo-hydrolase [Blastocatellia bacterium]
MKVVYNQGLYLPEIDLWMDARRPRACSVISHAHADHIQSHASIIATPATAKIFEHRVKPTDAILLDFYETKDFTDFKLTFYPAGHCLGSAQTLIEREGERVLYTGDFKLRTGLSCEPPEIVSCDTLIMDCTFGRPHFIFPEDEAVHQMLTQQIDRAFVEGKQPVVFGYSLGKSQEALKILLRGGYSVAVHHSIMAIVEIYREMGIEFEGDYRPLDYQDTDGLVVLMPPGAQRGYRAQAIENPYTIYLSGWAMDNRARYRYGTDSILPLSDHAGFDDLERYVSGSGAKKVYTLYGDHYFASHLRQMGIDAEHLQKPSAKSNAQPTPKNKKKTGDTQTLSLLDLIEGRTS